MEFWPHGIIGMQEDPRELLESLLSMGYAASTLHDGAPLEVDRALAELTSANEEWVNLVLVHETAGDQP